MVEPRLETDWLSLPPLQRLFRVFETEGATLRLVGGSVRDGLLGLPVQDIDLAVNRDPLWVLNLLSTHKIHAIPTGIAHGTITAILDHRPYQITTLRIDVKTFGRRAEVAFTDDWIQDAQRRDFTINAIYADKDGTIFDPVDGIEDLKNHIVRFIGDPDLRIQEDYLRILRFFRFSARFGKEPYDQAGLRACGQFAKHILDLARERVTEEFLKILDLPSPLSVLQAMDSEGVLAFIMPPSSWQILPALITLEQQGGVTPNPLIRIAALHPDFSELTTRLRLSNAQIRSLSFLAEDHPLITLASLKAQSYEWGISSVRDLALLQTAHRLVQVEISPEEGIHFLKTLQEPWEVPAFPLTGEDILAQGVPTGPQVGMHLKKVEEWWLASGLDPNREACLSYLSTFL